MALPAATLPPRRNALADVATVHAMDGDGASLCEQVAVDGLVTVDDCQWDDVPAEQRCVLCEAAVG